MNITPENDHFWIFGYGSLMWNPGFKYVESHLAEVEGLQRSPCIYSWVHRGTQERPGIVLGLDHGGSCTGLAFKVEAQHFDPVIGYLRDRELVTNVYLETKHPLVLQTGETVSAITYVVDRSHPQYAGQLDHPALMAQIRGASGKSGANEDYFLETANHLTSLKISDPVMERIARDLRS